jgi:hypothetical protein
MALRDALLPAVDAIRGIPGLLGLRLFTVAVVSRTWTGPRPGVGTSTDLTTGLKTDLGLYPVKVTMLTPNEVIASGGLYVSQDLRVGPITPPFSGSASDGDAITVFDPPATSTGFELFFRLTGPGYPASGGWFKKVSQDVTKSFRYSFVLRKTAHLP